MIGLRGSTWKRNSEIIGENQTTIRDEAKQVFGDDGFEVKPVPAHLFFGYDPTEQDPLEVNNNDGAEVKTVRFLDNLF